MRILLRHCLRSTCLSHISSCKILLHCHSDRAISGVNSVRGAQFCATRYWRLATTDLFFNTPHKTVSLFAFAASAPNAHCSLMAHLTPMRISEYTSSFVQNVQHLAELNYLHHSHFSILMLRNFDYFVN